MGLVFWIARHSGPHYVGQGVTVRMVHTLFFPITYLQ